MYECLNNNKLIFAKISSSVKYLKNLNNLILEDNRKKIEVNIITRGDSIVFEKFSNKNLKFIYHNILDKKAFEIMKLEAETH